VPRVEVLGEPQLALLRAHRVGVGSPVRIDDEQVHRVRADVEHTQAHGVTLAATNRRRAQQDVDFG